MPESNERNAPLEPNGKYARKGVVANYLGVCPRTVDNWMKSGVIPFMRVNRVVLFNLHEIEEALTKFKVAMKGSHRVRSTPKAYRAIVGQLPNEGKIIQVPAQSIYGFLAWTEEAVSEACSPRPVEVYCDMCCDNNDSKNRTRRLVAAVAPTILESRLTDRLSIQTSASDSQATPYHHWEWWKSPYVFTLNRDHPKCDHADLGHIYN